LDNETSFITKRFACGCLKAKIAYNLTKPNEKRTFDYLKWPLWGWQGNDPAKSHGEHDFKPLVFDFFDDPLETAPWRD
jgi:hypothetical protein